MTTPRAPGPDNKSRLASLFGGETLGRQLRGNVQLTYEPTGFVYALDVPMASLTMSAV